MMELEDNDYESDFEDASDDEGGSARGTPVNARRSKRIKEESLSKALAQKPPASASGQGSRRVSREDKPSSAVPTERETPVHSSHSTPRQSGALAGLNKEAPVSGREGIGSRRVPRPEAGGAGSVEPASGSHESHGRRAGRGGAPHSPSAGLHGRKGSDPINNVQQQRPVRGRVGIGGGSSSQQHSQNSYDTGGVIAGHAPIEHSAARDRPAWLQHDEGFSRPASHGRARPERVDRHAVGRELCDSAGVEELKEEQRKNKRLQQEVKRLSDRLKESDLFSGQDDGLTVFLLDEVEMGPQISQGGFSMVLKAKWRYTPCAIKKIFDPVITDDLRAEFENEVRMLRRLRHPNVVTLMAVCRQPPALSIMTEFIDGGTLWEFIHSPMRTRREHEDAFTEVMPIIEQAAGALAYLHATLIVHRDIKPHNVLISGHPGGDGHIAKLCDFGLARMQSELCTGINQWAGTAPYMAPELFQKKRYTEAVDIFAFGVMIWEGVAFEIPHANMEASDIAHRVCKEDGAGLSVNSSWPKRLKTLLKSTLAVSAEKRPKISAILEALQSAFE